MVQKIDREDVQRMVTDGAQLVDTLSEEEYAAEHIAGAISLPLRKLDGATAARLAKDRPVIVYCFDTD